MNDYFKTNFIKYFITVGFAILALYLTFNKHKNSGYFNYHSEIFGDKAGYYVYLPATFNFKFDPHQFPDTIDKRTGDGFRLDYLNNKVVTKYTCGIAILQTPFYLMAEKLARNARSKPSGFSLYHHKCVNVASIFYLVLGFLFLARFLGKYYKTHIIVFVLLTLFLGTNLYYYSIEDTGMTHVYSFSLFCMYLFFLQKTDYLLTSNAWQFLLFGILSGLIILIRPTNAIFLTTNFFLFSNGKQDVLDRIKRLFQFKLIFTIIGFGLISTPQLLYWEYLQGSPLYYSYGEEGFKWLNPQPMLSWFSPNNGLFIYTPIYVIIILSLILMIKKKIRNGVYILFLFLLLTYVLSSWWVWHFGCSFGGRSYVEYYAIMSIPLAYLMSKISYSKKLYLIGFCSFIVVCSVYNLKMTYAYDKCFFGEMYWDWATYLKLLSKAF
ncbi:hypothetical protein ACFLRI_00880 [Bacteroidota bacterium]